MKAEDFTLGAQVVCPHPTQFISPLNTYLANRIGTVVRIFPSTADKEWAGQRNKVLVRWHKRNGRGKEKERLMEPRNITLAT